MKKKIEEKQAFCGNCSSHNAYDYPDLVFCTGRFRQNKNPIVKTLWRCDDWNENAQKCHCIEDAQKNGNKKT
jgi:hypothetical protein